MTDDRRRKLAFLYRVSAEKERQLGSRRNWRSFAGIGRKWNAGWVMAGIGVLHRGIGAVRKAGWVMAGIGVLHRGTGAVRNASWVNGRA